MTKTSAVNTLPKKKLKEKAKFNNSHLRILSRHPSAKGLRGTILIPGKRVVYRHGSTTIGNFKYEINPVESIKISANKRRMKEKFDTAGISHSAWIPLSESNQKLKEFLKKIGFPKAPVIAKHVYGSRGTGNYYITDEKSLNRFLENKKGSLSSYIIEEYKKYSVEYRLHVDKNGCFYACRKMLKKDTPENQRFQRHDDNCVWFVETNPQFNKPANWDEIVTDCVKALKSIGADVLAFDVKSTSTKDKKDKKCSWIVIESCSAPSFGEVTIQKYKQRLPLIVKEKYKQ